VDEATFEAVTRVTRDNSKRSPRRAEPGQWMLRALVKCGTCGVGVDCHKMRGRNGTWHRYNHCRNHDPIKAGGPDKRRSLYDSTCGESSTFARIGFSTGSNASSVMDGFPAVPVRPVPGTHQQGERPFGGQDLDGAGGQHGRVRDDERAVRIEQHHQGGQLRRDAGHRRERVAGRAGSPASTSTVIVTVSTGAPRSGGRQPVRPAASRECCGAARSG